VTPVSRFDCVVICCLFSLRPFDWCSLVAELWVLVAIVRTDASFQLVRASHHGVLLPQCETSCVVAQVLSLCAFGVVVVQWS